MLLQNILEQKRSNKNGETYTTNENQVIFDGNKFSFVPKTPVALSETHGIDAVNASKKGKKSPLITVSTAKTL